MAASFEAVSGIGHMCRKNSTVSDMRSQSNIPPINAVKSKCLPELSIFVDNNFCSLRGERIWR
eukprot:14884712-Ditylum_brightwellii.AAC.1